MSGGYGRIYPVGSIFISYTGCVTDGEAWFGDWEYRYFFMTTYPGVRVPARYALDAGIRAQEPKGAWRCSGSPALTRPRLAPGAAVG